MWWEMWIILCSQMTHQILKVVQRDNISFEYQLFSLSYLYIEKLFLDFTCSRCEFLLFCFLFSKFDFRIFNFEVTFFQFQRFLSSGQKTSKNNNWVFVINVFCLYQKIPITKLKQKMLSYLLNWSHVEERAL